MSLGRQILVLLSLCGVMLGACATSVDDDDELAADLDPVTLDDRDVESAIEAVGDVPELAAAPGCSNLVEDIPEIRICDGVPTEVCVHHCVTRRVKLPSGVCVSTGTTCDPVVCECP